VTEGDEKAFQELFHLYKQQVYAYAMHFTRSVMISEEIVQDIFLKLWLHKTHLREIDRFEAYLYTITRNHCFDHLKKLAREHAMKQQWILSVDPSDESAEDKVIYNNYESLIHQALESLPPQQKKVYALSFYHGRKQEEIAQHLHISRNTVKVHLAKARATVRNYLAAHLEAVVLLLMSIFFHHGI
jgi:RNA polymerase sigma-70 factor (ECF subfamily)